MATLVQPLVATQRRASLLKQGQWLCLYLLVIVVPNSYRVILWTIPEPKPNVLAEWQGIVVYPADAPLILLIVLSLIRLFRDMDYARHLWQTLIDIHRRAWIWAVWVV